MYMMPSVSKLTTAVRNDVGGFLENACDSNIGLVLLNINVEVQK